MKLALVGTCQVEGMAEVARRLLRDADIVSHHVGAAFTGAEIAVRLAGCDHVVMQVPPVPLPAADPLSIENLTRGGRRFVGMPPVVFTGFHPDMFYLMVGGRPADGPLGQYHSQISLAGFLAGLDVDRTTALFNAHVFAELGYFDAYAVAEKSMIQRFAEQNFRLNGLLRRWRERGRIFMHTINHPTIALLERLTVMALARLELIDERQPRVRGLPDALGESVVAPVFAPIARRLGIRPCDDFLQPVEWTAPGETRAVTLDDYVARAFELYRTHDPEDLHASTAEPVIARIRALIA